ncbi:MAG: hypothetical protein KAH67_10475 [Flavobacteriaceae bacterium]|nr:hypothetical protein [Candidatus Gracilibacteria bacterium]MCK5639130.1 hypothetical protein [Flavobacteriaceae bacterium]
MKIKNIENLSIEQINYELENGGKWWKCQQSYERSWIQKLTKSKGFKEICDKCELTSEPYRKVSSENDLMNLYFLTNLLSLNLE